MHVLIITQYFPPDLGGSTTRAYNIAKGLTLNNVEVTVITTFPHYPRGEIPSQYRWMPYKFEKMEEINVLRTFIFPIESKGLLRRLILFICFICSSLIGLLFVKNINIIWVANPELFGMVPGLIYSKLHKIPIVLNVDDLSIEDVNNLKIMKNKSIGYKIVKLLSKLMYRKPEALTPISPGYVEILQSYGVDRKKIFIIMGGVDLEIFRNKNYIKRTNSKFRVIYSGSFSIAYDFDQVIKAAKILENKGSFEFILQGKGELELSMRSLIKNLNVLNVKIYSEVLSRKNLSRFLNTANALILPLRDFGVPYLGISTKLFEYQAVGKPIICCAYGQPAMYITETKSGLNVFPGNLEKLVEAIVELSKNKKMSENFGKAGILFVENNLSLDKIGSNIKQVFLNILEQNSRARKHARELLNFM